MDPERQREHLTAARACVGPGFERHPSRPVGRQYRLVGSRFASKSSLTHEAPQPHVLKKTTAYSFIRFSTRPITGRFKKLLDFFLPSRVS